MHDALYARRDEPARYGPNHTESWLWLLQWSSFYMPNCDLMTRFAWNVTKLLFTFISLFFFISLFYYCSFLFFFLGCKQHVNEINENWLPLIFSSFPFCLFHSFWVTRTKNRYVYHGNSRNITFLTLIRWTCSCRPIRRAGAAACLSSVVMWNITAATRTSVW